ncbi:hypothetical protein GCM10028812_45080 [Ancylobacter sonchi]|uniref:DUF930 domain-containing protein n=1 Tax=Ancylobacter sonchi TaxID=1937790 RepID=UPI0028B19F17|nr:DUF930 domain-containing protein [Ancylobacter sonchi]
MKRVALTMLALAAASALPQVGAQAKTTDEQMLMLDPAARVEQRCNSRGMGEIGREHKGMHPDEMVAYAYANTKLHDQHLIASGAAVRSGSTWYHLSYSCETANDGMDIKSFSYKLGEAIPRSEWEAHYLVAP